MRVSSQQLFDSGVAALQQHLQGVVESQRQISSGQRHGKASDDPLAAGLGVQLSLKRAEFNMFKVNQNHVEHTLDQTDAQLSSLQQMLANFQQMMIQTTSPGIDDAGRKQMASNAQALMAAVTQFSSAKDASGQAILKGDGGVGMVAVAPSIDIQTGIELSGVMGDPLDPAKGVDILQAMQDVSTALQSGLKPSDSQFVAIKDALSQVSKAQVKTGVLLNLLASARQTSAFQEAAVNQQRSNLLDTDPAQAAADLARSNALLQAAQSIMARLDASSLFQKI
jgi:flagellar hook-associated protein 3 FlgL